MTVYQPREDSKLLAKAILEKDLSGKRCLDMGTGTGIIARKMLHAGAEEVVAVDKNPEAVEEAREKLGEEENIEIFESDLFEEVEGKFDLIAFNPPYLPDDTETDDDDQLFGGESGEEITEKFLKKSGEYLKNEGEVLFLVSSKSGFDREGYEIVDTEKLWFENLFVLKSE